METANVLSTVPEGESEADIPESVSDSGTKPPYAPPPYAIPFSFVSPPPSLDPLVPPPPPLTLLCCVIFRLPLFICRLA